MLVAVKGKIQGNTILLEDDVTAYEGSSVVVTILDLPQKKKSIDFDKYSKPTGRTAEEIDTYVRGLRDNDRL